MSVNNERFICYDYSSEILVYRVLLGLVHDCLLVHKIYLKLSK
jgi:hypothetical protein